MRSHPFKIKSLAFLLSGLLLLSLTGAHAQTSYWWDADGAGVGTGGSGTWNTATSLWRSGSSGGSLTTWPSTNPSTSTAVFAGSAGRVTIASGATIYANKLDIQTNGYEFASGDNGSKLVLNGSAPSIVLPTGGSFINFNTKMELAAGAVTTVTGANAGIGWGYINQVPGPAGTGNYSLLLGSGGTLDLFSSGARGSLLTVGRQDQPGSAVLLDQNTTFDLTGGTSHIYVTGLRVGLRIVDNTGLPIASNGNITAVADFGSNSGSILDSSVSGTVGGIGIRNNTYIGTVAGTMNIGGGTNSIAGLTVGSISSDASNANLTNTATATGVLNLTGGTTGLTFLALAARSSYLNPNSTASGTLNLTGGTLNMTGDIYGGGGSIALTNSTVTLDGGTLNLNGNILGRSTGLITNLNIQSGTLTGVSEINNGAVLNKTTAGTLTLSGTNSHTGGTTLTAGTLQAGSDTALGSGTLILTSGKFSSDSTTARAISNAVTFGGDVTLGDATKTGALTFNGAGTLTGNRTITTDSNVTYAGVIGGGTNGLTKAGASTLTLTAANTYTGGTTVSSGTLALSGAGRLADTGAVTVNNGGTFDLGGVSDSVGAVALSGGTISNGTLTGTSYAVQSGSVSAVLAGSGAVTKSTVDSVTFSAVNTYTGNTIVSGGTLILSGSGSIANSAVVDVQAGAILSTSGVTFGTGQTVKGNGTIIGDTILQGTLAAGNSPGILSFDDDLTLTSSANSVFEIQNTGMVRGTDYDGVNVVSSVLTYDGTLTLSLTALVGDGTYNLFDFGSIAGNFDTVAFSGGIYTGTFSHSGGFWTATDMGGSGQTFSFELASGNLTVIPEPSTTLLLAGALTALVIFRRRRA